LAQEEDVRNVIKWTLVPIAVAAVACGKTQARKTAMSESLKQDLQLASHTQDIQISPDEIAPQSHKAVALKKVEAPHAPKVIRTRHPTVKASPRPVEVADVESNAPQIEVMPASPAPSESPTPDAPPMARPSPTPAPTYPSTASVPGNSGSGIGAILGAVLRGAIMDGDDCDPRGHPRAGRPIGGGDIIGNHGRRGGVMPGMGMPGMPMPRFPF
jgi:hypothetical protein